MAEGEGMEGDSIEELLEWLRVHGGEGKNRFHKRCRVWRDAEGGKRMTQPAMEAKLKDIKGVGKNSKGKVVPKEEWQVKKVRAAIRTFGTDAWEQMDVAERKVDIDDAVAHGECVVANCLVAFATGVVMVVNTVSAVNLVRFKLERDG